jgi:hypothetical protein
MVRYDRNSATKLRIEYNHCRFAKGNQRAEKGLEETGVMQFGWMAVLFLRPTDRGSVPSRKEEDQLITLRNPANWVVVRRVEGPSRIGLAGLEAGRCGGRYRRVRSGRKVAGQGIPDPLCFPRAQWPMESTARTLKRSCRSEVEGRKPVQPCGVLPRRAVRVARVPGPTRIVWANGWPDINPRLRDIHL